MDGREGGREVYFEFIAVGNVVRVTAICAVSGLEVHLVAPRTAGRGDLERLALAKLRARLAAERPAPLPGRGQGGGGGSGRFA